MRIQPRQQLLEIWRATAQASLQDGEWVWGGRSASSSISDAEQMLCIMLPATEIPQFRLDRPDETDKDVLQALRGLGDHVDIPLRLVRTLIAFMNKHADAEGVPVFPGGTYVETKDPSRRQDSAQSTLDVVESFATSVTLSLATIGFCGVLRGNLSRPTLISEVTELERLANQRLTAALVGLLRSFTINVFTVDSEYGRNLLRTINQEYLPERIVVERFSEQLREVRVGLRDYVTVGTGQNVDLDPSRLFECGWSWGVIENAPKIPFVDGALQREGHALDAPYLYFTVVALDSIADLSSSRTRLLGLLDEEQQRLARALQIRWDLTQRYWAAVASFGNGRWPLEDIPWRTVDGEESDYLSLLATAIAARDLAERRDTDTDLSRLGQILKDLASRGRLTRRPSASDAALRLHNPGVSIPLEFDPAFDKPDLVYGATDFAPLLLKRIVRVAALINDIDLRGSLLDLSDQVWDHISLRRLREGTARGLWDQPGQVFDEITVEYDQPSWHHTVRVVESLVFAAELAATPPLRSDRLAKFAHELLAEAEHLFDLEQLAGSTEGGTSMRQSLEVVRRRLQRVREIVDNRPGSAAAVLLTVLTDIDQFAAARSDLTGQD